MPDFGDSMQNVAGWALALSSCVCVALFGSGCMHRRSDLGHGMFCMRRVSPSGVMLVSHKAMIPVSWPQIWLVCVNGCMHLVKGTAATLM
jgi:hypothetical protein